MRGGTMDVTLRLVDGTADELRSLRSWLTAEDELRGRVAAVENGPETGRLGPTLTGLLVDLVPGAAPVLAATVMAWIRSRRGDIDMTAERDGDRTTISVSARRVRGLDADAVRAEIIHLAHALKPSPQPDGAPADSAPIADRPDLSTR
ncbi:hypothetical protein [Frankia sp. CIT1]|uniref:effector-associated constant component EACC1 n=1 Tax=Frankia sp. CIT1 TaxID=2880974 RepID=UPI001EF5ACAD|nr:hypothetical protein [Frankia sp. CIT1]